MSKDAVKSKIRVGQISYTNCIPFYHGLQDFEFTKAVPTELNAAMSEGRMDIAPVSSLEYLLHAEDYYLLPQLGICARDFSGSVILFSKEKIENLDGLEIAVSNESLSSVTLLKILMKFKYKFENSYKAVPSKPDKMLQEHTAALVIGDDALFYQPKEFVYKYDLAELWWNWAEKPFCFAVWAVRKQFADANREEVTRFWQKLRKNAERNLSDIETTIKESLSLSFLDEKFPKVFGYLFNLNYGLDQEGIEGLELFYRLAHRLKAAPKPERPQFFEPA